MVPIVSELTLQRYRSVVGGIIRFDNPTFLVGRNGSGKTNVVDALGFLADCTTAPLSAVFEKRGGIEAVRNRTSVSSHPPNVGLAIKFGSLNGEVLGGRYAFEVKALSPHGYTVKREHCVVVRKDGERVWFDRSKQDFTSNAKGLAPALDPMALVLPLVAGDARFNPALKILSGIRIHAIEPATLRELQEPDSGTFLRHDGSNAASVLKEIERQAPEDVNRICEILNSIVPNTVRIRPIKHGKKLSIEFTQEWNPKKRLKFEAFSMSDGTLRALGLILGIYQKPTPTLIAIEEPEATIHPGALGSILDLLQFGSNKLQVVVTTHSPDLLEAEWIEDRHLRVVEWQEGETRVGRVSERAQSALRDHLMGAGELLRSNALDAVPLFDGKEGKRECSQMNLFETQG